MSETRIVEILGGNMVKEVRLADGSWRQVQILAPSDARAIKLQRQGFDVYPEEIAAMREFAAVAAR